MCRGGGLDKVQDRAEVAGIAAVGIGDVEAAALVPEAAGRPEQPYPVTAGPGPRGHPAQVREVAVVHGQDQVPAGQPGRLDLPGPVRRPVVAAAAQLGAGVGLHPVPDVPVTGPGAVHRDRLRQAGGRQLRPQGDLGHG